MVKLIKQNQKQLQNIFSWGILIFLFSRTYISAIWGLPDVRWLLHLTRIIAFAKIGLDIFQVGFSKNWIFNGLILFAMIAFIFTQDFNLLSHLLILLALRTEQVDHVIKKAFWINSVLLFSIILLGQLGVIHAHVWIESNRTRHLLGFDNPNMPMRSFFIVWASFVYIKWEKFLFKHHWKSSLVIGVILPVVLLQLTASRMPMMSMVLGYFLILLLSITDTNKKLIKLGLTSIPIFFTIMSIVIGKAFGDSLFLNSMLSSRPRFWNSMIMQTEYPLKFFGYHGMILHQLYDGDILILDNSFLYVFWVQGIGFFIIFFALLTYLIYHAATQNNKKMTFLILMMLIYGFGENIFFDMGASVVFFLIYLACEELLNVEKPRLERTEEGKMKILYCITRSDWGGAQVHLFDLIREMTAKGHCCVVAVGEEGELSERLNKIGIKTHLLKSLKHDIHLIKDIKGIFELRQLINEINPDFIHLHSTKAGWIGRISGLLEKKKVIFTAHGWCFTEGVTGFRKRLGKVIEKALVPITDQIICVSDYDRKLALKSGVGSPEKITVVYNGVAQIEKVKTHRDETKKIKVMMTARFADPKDQGTVIKAIKHIEQDVELYLVGDGPNLAQYQALAKSLNLDESVHFLGSRNDVGILLQEMDIFVLSSNYEALPISIIEAMSTGLPIVASDVGGVKEMLIEGENGYLFRPRDVIALREIIIALTDKKKRIKMGQKSLKFYEEKFTLARCVQETLMIYERLFEMGEKNEFE